MFHRSRTHGTPQFVPKDEVVQKHFLKHTYFILRQNAGNPIVSQEQVKYYSAKALKNLDNAPLP